MSEIRIEWLHEYSDCDQAGCGGGYAEGAKVWIDGDLAIEMLPVAHCFGGITHDQEDVYRAIFARIGHTLIVEPQ